MVTILYIKDDKDISDSVAGLLALDGYAVISNIAMRGADGYQVFGSLLELGRTR